MNSRRKVEGKTQDEVDILLKRLQGLRREVAEARSDSVPLEDELKIAHNEYLRRVGPLLREILKLRGELQRLNQSADFEEVIVDNSGVDREPATEILKAPDAVEKDKLMEHAYRVLDSMVSAVDEELIGRLQGMVSNNSMNLGEVLERMEWGRWQVVWRSRAYQESVDDQYSRLDGWVLALKNQLTFLNKRKARLLKHRHYGLLQQRRKGPFAWRRFLDVVASQYEQEREELRGEIRATCGRGPEINSSRRPL